MKKRTLSGKKPGALFLVWYNCFAMNYTNIYYSPQQGRLPLYITDILDICDPVLAFDKIMEEIKKNSI